MNILSGYKTYLGYIGLGLAGIFRSLGWIDDNTALIIVSIAGPLAGVGHAHKQAKTEKKLKEVAIR